MLYICTLGYAWAMYASLVYPVVGRPPCVHAVYRYHAGSVHTDGLLGTATLRRVLSVLRCCCPKVFPPPRECSSRIHEKGPGKTKDCSTESHVAQGFREC